MFLSEWREFPSAPSLAGKNLDNMSRLNVVETARVSDMLPICFLPGRAKDLSAPWYKTATFHSNMNMGNQKVFESVRFSGMSRTLSHSTQCNIAEELNRQ